MNPMKTKLLSAACFLVAAPVFAGPVEMAPPQWEIEGRGHRFETHDGKESLYLDSAVAVLKDAEFENGVIEYDVLFEKTRNFAGVSFRRDAAGLNHEDFYIRPHQSGNPDANQYTPVFNGVPGWQIYYGPAYATPLEYRHGEWTHVKLVVKDDRADIYIDGDEPVLHVADLKHAQQAGGVALWTLIGSAHFANLTVTPTDDVDIVGTPGEDRPVPEGLVRQWMVSDPVAAATLEDRQKLPRDVLDARTWSSLAAETNGVANLARAAQFSPDENTVLARLELRSDKAQTKRLRFGFSDAVRVYVNGTLMFDGDDVFGSRDYRHLGTVGLYDALHVPLRKGRNEIVFAVRENFGGWAVMAALDDSAGVTVSGDAQDD